MPAPRVVRPSADFFTDLDGRPSQALLDLEAYLGDQWMRMEQARRDQVDEKYAAWQRDYDGEPRVRERTIPWPGASNYVVQVSRMFIDTFVARTLNIIFATRPLYTLDFLPEEVREATQKYINKKALAEWKHYNLCHDMLFRGAKNGTVIQKTTYVVEEEYDVIPSDDESSHTEELVTTYDGPSTTVIPFEDFYIYPITCNRIEDAEILAHRVRMVEEVAVRRALDNGWPISSDEIRAACVLPQDIKRDQEQAQAGVSDQWLREFTLIEMHLKYDLNRNGKYYRIIALFEPTTRRIFDLYYHPYPRNLNIFRDYRPLPREDFFFGDSWVKVLAQTQDEASTIHNDRRNASFIMNCPLFKRKRGAMVPNPSSTWYPGKVWDLENMDDFEIIPLKGNYNDMLAEENHDLMLAERLVGLGALQQGNASGMMGKRGIYNAAGTLAVISESNQRQDTNIRDVREVLGDIAKKCFTLQSMYNPNDPMIDAYPAQQAQQIRQGLSMIGPDLLRSSYFEIKPSDAGANSETHKASMMQLAQVVGSYSAAIPQYAQQLRMLKDPVLAQILAETIKMQRIMTIKLLRAFGDYDTETWLPDIEGAFRAGQTGMAEGQPTSGGPQGVPPDIPTGPSNGTGSAEIQQLLARNANLLRPNA